MTLLARDLPGAFIGGAQKSGTTALHWLLAAHREIFVPRASQEIHFFDLEENYRQGLPWLRAFFAGRTSEPVALQTSPLYLYEPKVPARIREVAPEARLIFILRHPVDRAYSHYWHEIRFGWEDQSFEEALRREPERIRGGFEARRRWSYLDRGRYGVQLALYLDHFPREQILVLRSEDLRQRPADVARRAAAFLGVDPEGWGSSPAFGRGEVNPAKLPRLPALQRLTRHLRPRLPRLVHLVDLANLRAVRYPPMAEETRRRLEDLFAPEIEAAARLSSVDLSSWLPPPEGARG